MQNFLILSFCALLTVNGIWAENERNFTKQYKSKDMDTCIVETIHEKAYTIATIHQFICFLKFFNITDPINLPIKIFTSPIYALALPFLIVIEGKIIKHFSGYCLNKYYNHQ